MKLYSFFETNSVPNSELTVLNKKSKPSEFNQLLFSTLWGNPSPSQIPLFYMDKQKVLCISICIELGLCYFIPIQIDILSLLSPISMREYVGFTTLIQVCVPY